MRLGLAVNIFCEIGAEPAQDGHFLPFTRTVNCWSATSNNLLLLVLSGRNMLVTDALDQVWTEARPELILPPK
jgi:hypothetical protein